MAEIHRLFQHNFGQKIKSQCVVVNSKLEHKVKVIKMLLTFLCSYARLVEIDQLVQKMGLRKG